MRPTLTIAQQAELESRLADAEDDRPSMVTWEQLKKELLQRTETLVEGKKKGFTRRRGAAEKK